MFPWQLTLFQSVGDFQHKKHQMVAQTRANIFICLLDQAHEPPLANIKMERQRCLKYCGAYLVESFCKESNISGTNWLIYLSSSYLIKIWLSVRRHQLCKLHISKTWISLERKEIFENSKQHFSDYFLCFKMAEIGKMRFLS